MLAVTEVPCRYCLAKPGQRCFTRGGNRYPKGHVKRKDLAAWVNDGTIRKLIRAGG